MRLCTRKALGDWTSGKVTRHPRCLCSALDLLVRISPRTTTFLQLVTVVFKKMYEIRIKQLQGELIKITTIRYSTARFRFCHSKFNFKAKKNLVHCLILYLA